MFLTLSLIYNNSDHIKQQLHIFTEMYYQNFAVTQIISHFMWT